MKTSNTSVASRANSRATRRIRGDKGATTAEYVGIIVFVTLLVTSIVSLTTPIGDKAYGTVRAAYCHIGTAIGAMGGCGPDDLPGYIPDKCTVNSHNGSGGGSVTVVVKVGGDAGYELMEVRERQPDGSIKTSYVVRTQGKVGAGFEFTPGPKVEVDAGDDSAGAKPPSINVGADAAWGSQYTFGSQTEAQDFIDEYKDNFGEFGSEPDGAPPSDSTYVDLSGQASIEGNAGPLKLSAGGTATLGIESYSNGDKKVKAALTLDAAASLGIPIPDSILELSADGSLKAMVVADVTFDKDGNLIKLGGSLQLSVEGEANIGLDRNINKGLADGDGRIKGLDLPKIPALEAGKQYQLNFTTDFTRPGGEVDHSALSALGDGAWNLLTGNGGLTDEQKAAITNQLNNHSEITFNDYDYDRDEQKYGGSIGIGPIKVGAEGHVVTVDKNLNGGYYYDPVLGEWQENVVCGR